MSNGASVVIQDPRVSQALRWFWGVLGVGIISVVGLAAKNLYQLNLTVSRMVDAGTITATTLKDHEDRIRTLERDRRNEPAR